MNQLYSDISYGALDSLDASHFVNPEHSNLVYTRASARNAFDFNPAPHKQRVRPLARRVCANGDA